MSGKAMLVAMPDWGECVSVSSAWVGVARQESEDLYTDAAAFLLNQFNNSKYASLRRKMYRHKYESNKNHTAASIFLKPQNKNWALCLNLILTKCILNIYVVRISSYFYDLVGISVSIVLVQIYLV